MPFKFITEMPDGCGYRPGSSIAKRTNCIAFDLTLNIPKQIDVSHFSFSVFYVVENFFHPACAFATGRTLTATFMTIEACKCKCVTHHALIFVEHNETT